LSDVREASFAIDWASENARGRDFEVYAVISDPTGRSYVRIVGVDGNADGGATESITFTT